VAWAYFVVLDLPFAFRPANDNGVAGVFTATYSDCDIPYLVCGANGEWRANDGSVVLSHAQYPNSAPIGEALPAVWFPAQSSESVFPVDDRRPAWSLVLQLTVAIAGAVAGLGRGLLLLISDIAGRSREEEYSARLLREALPEGDVQFAMSSGLGYSPEEVDHLLDKVVELRRTTLGRANLEELLQDAAFHLVRRGYDAGQVDAHLDQLRQSLEAGSEDTGASGPDPTSQG
jgi:DivIVA domain-containing protein